MQQTKQRARRVRLSPILCGILLFLADLCFFSAKWFVDVYGRIGFDSILYTLQSELDGVQSGLVGRYLLCAFLPTLLAAALEVYLLFFLTKRGKFQRKPMPGWISPVIAVVLSVILIGHAAWNVELDDYIRYQSTDTDLYENYYVDPASASITFPEEKRNLIYIYLESMEVSYLSQELGGAMEENLIPELYELAKENTNFSNSSADVGGFYTTSGATWTIGAMVAQTAGIPLKTPTEDCNDYGSSGEDFLPGVTSLTNILHDAGYYQAFMVGSDADFGGRTAYFIQHGMDTIYDIYTARKDGIVPSDYFVWWGMEDLHLFEYAKQELTEIAAQDQPFAFTMLTVDTHHVGGYQCELCEESTSGETYDQSISCSSRQVAEFVKWIQAQDFYENTTIIIVGDHESMDNGYFERNVDDDYQRLIYNCIINSAVETTWTKNRQFAGVDLFPTTLAAIGCQIEGDRLGLGTNLFSNLPTLTEKLGFASFNTELSRASEYYEINFYEDYEAEKPAAEPTV